MWKVLFTALAEKEIRDLVKQRRISKEDRQVIAVWIRLVSEHGPDTLENKKLWDDNPLEKECAGFRSSAYSYSGRIIYKIIKNKIVIVVVRVTPDHDYKRIENERAGLQKNRFK